MDLQLPQEKYAQVLPPRGPPHLLPVRKFAEMLSPEHLSEREVAESVSPAMFCVGCCEVFQHGRCGEREPTSGVEALDL